MPLAAVIHHWLDGWAAAPSIYDVAPYDYYVFERISAQRLTMVPATKRSRFQGWKDTEGFTIVSERFRINVQIDRDVIDPLVATAWAAHAGSPDATLQTAIHTELRAAGIKRYDGSALS